LKGERKKKREKKGGKRGGKRAQVHHDRQHRAKALGTPVDLTRSFKGKKKEKKKGGKEKKRGQGGGPQPRGPTCQYHPPTPESLGDAEPLYLQLALQLKKKEKRRKKKKRREKGRGRKKRGQRAVDRLRISLLTAAIHYWFQRISFLLCLEGNKEKGEKKKRGKKERKSGLETKPRSAGQQ